MDLTEMEVSLNSSLIFCKVAIILGVFPWTHKIGTHPTVGLLICYR